MDLVRSTEYMQGVPALNCTWVHSVRLHCGSVIHVLSNKAKWRPGGRIMVDQPGLVKKRRKRPLLATKLPEQRPIRMPDPAGGM